MKFLNQYWDKLQAVQFEYMPLKYPEVPTSARYQLQQLLAEASLAVPEAPPEVYCYEWERYEEKLVEIYEAEAMERPYDLLKEKLAGDTEKKKIMEKQFEDRVLSGAI